MIRILPFFLLASCVSAPVDLKLPEKKCEHMFMPPVPKKATLIIDGDKISADEGGELLLRGYVVYRVDKLEKDFATHQQKHDDQYKEIMSNIIDMKMKLIEMSDRNKPGLQH